MKKQILNFVLTSIGCLHFQHIYAQLDPQQIIEQFLNMRNEHTSVSYDIRYFHKSFSMEDTLLYKSRVQLIRIPTDSLFHGILSMDLDSVWYGYNGVLVYRADKDASLLEYDSVSVNPGAFILSNYVYNLVDDGFLTNNQALKYITQMPEYDVRFSDTLYRGLPALAMRIRILDEAGFTNQEVNSIIDPVNLFTVKKSFSSWFQGNQQYQEWNFENYQYGNDTSIALLAQDQIASYSKTKRLELRSESETDSIRFDFSTVYGKILLKDEYIDFSEQEAPFTILDFWYTSCYPCIKSIPAINQIALHYKDKGVSVYGVNLIDDEIKSKARLEKFLVNNSMVYPTIMMPREMEQKMGIQSFPTFLILDKGYKVIFRDEGFSENLYDEISAFLDARL